MGGEAPVTSVSSLDSSSLNLSYKPCDNRDDGRRWATSPEEILQVRGRKFHDRAVREYLVKWQGLSVEHATWENEQVLQFPGLKLLEDKKIWAGRTVMSRFS